jgi:hypothetical protein
MPEKAEAGLVCLAMAERLDLDQPKGGWPGWLGMILFGLTVCTIVHIINGVL